MCVCMCVQTHIVSITKRTSFSSHAFSHGDEHPHNTETPLVVWGAGIGAPEPQHFVSRPVYWSAPTTSPPEWGLDHLTRIDVHQADVAPLAASLLSLPVPVNSVGVLPVDLLVPDVALRAAALAANARQVHELLLRKDGLTRASALLFRKFPRLEEAAELRSVIERERSAGKYDSAIGMHLTALVSHLCYWFDMCCVTYVHAILLQDTS